MRLPLALILTSALVVASGAAQAGVMLNSHAREVKMKQEAEAAAIAAEANASGKSVEDVTKKRAEANNALTAAIYAAEAKMEQAAAYVKSTVQGNMVANLEKDAAEAEKRGDTATLNIIKARIEVEKAKAAEAAAKVAEHSAEADKNLTHVTTSVKKVVVGEGANAGAHPPIPGFEEKPAYKYNHEAVQPAE